MAYHNGFIRCQADDDTSGGEQPVAEWGVVDRFAVPATLLEDLLVTDGVAMVTCNCIPPAGKKGGIDKPKTTKMITKTRGTYTNFSSAIQSFTGFEFQVSRSGIILGSGINREVLIAEGSFVIISRSTSKWARSSGRARYSTQK